MLAPVLASPVQGGHGNTGMSPKKGQHWSISLMRESKEDLGRLILLPSDRTRGSGQHLKYRKFHLNLRRNHFFTAKVIEHQDRFLREVMECPFLEIFKTQLDIVLGKLLCWTCFEQRDWTTQPPELPFHLNCSVTLGFHLHSVCSYFLLPPFDIAIYTGWRALLTSHSLYFCEPEL